MIKLNPFANAPTTRGRWIPEIGDNLRPAFKKLAESLRLIERARDAGAENLPDKGDHDLDETQRQVVAETQAGINMLKQFLSNQLNGAKDKIAGRAPRTLNPTLAMADTRAAVSEAKLQCAADLETARMEERRCLRGLNLFRRNNNLARDAAYADDTLLPAAILIGLVFLEGAFNAFIFQDAVTTGWIGGLGLAALFGAVNVLAGFLIVGYLGLRLIEHIRPLFKAIGALFVATGVATGIGWNLLIAHYREALERNPDTSFLDPELLQSPGRWADLSSVEAWALLILGAAIFALAALKGRGGRGCIDDPYWGYRAVDLTYREADASYQAAKDAYKNAIQHAYGEALAALRRTYDTDQAAVIEIEEIVGQAEERVAEVRDSIGEWCEMGVALLRAYREENRAVRDVNSEPAYFATYPTFEAFCANLPDAAALRAHADKAADTLARNAETLADLEQTFAEAREAETETFLDEIDAVGQRVEEAIQNDHALEADIHTLPTERNAA